jgi:hypothetical protein
MTDSDNSQNPDYIEYYQENAGWENDWVPMCFCTNCCSYSVSGSSFLLDHPALE